MKLYRKEVWISLLLLVLIILFIIVEFSHFGKIGFEEASHYNQQNISQTENKQIAVVGDLQTTSFWELLIGRESNDRERELIVNQIVKEKPSMLIILGDMVFDGSVRAQLEGLKQSF